MSAQLNYARFPGMGDLPGDSTNRNSPDYEDSSAPTILDDANSVGSWLVDHAEDAVFETASEAIADYLTGPTDEYAQRKFARVMLAFADTCRERIVEMERSA